MDNPVGLGSVLPRPLLARSAPWEIERSVRDSARGVLVYIYIYIYIHILFWGRIHLLAAVTQI